MFSIKSLGTVIVSKPNIVNKLKIVLSTSLYMLHLCTWFHDCLCHFVTVFLDVPPEVKSQNCL